MGEGEDDKDSGTTIDENTPITIDDTDIILRTNSQTTTIDQLSQITIPTPTGPINIQQLGTFQPKPNPTQINRINGQREITVSAGVIPEASITEINAQLLQHIQTNLNLAPEYTYETGGANQENEESVQSIIQAMGLAAILILVTMVIQLGSFRKALIILLTIPLAISGVFIIFALAQIPLSFPALIGLLALFGIVVNNAIVIIDKINQNQKIGMNLTDSIADAATGRLESILFSSLTTIAGLAPITLSNPVWEGTGGAIIAGLLFSGTLMLIFIPTLYYSWFHTAKTKLS